MTRELGQTNKATSNNGVLPLQLPPDFRPISYHHLSENENWPSNRSKNRIRFERRRETSFSRECVRQDTLLNLSVQSTGAFARKNGQLIVE